MPPFLRKASRLVMSFSLHGWHLTADWLSCLSSWPVIDIASHLTFDLFNPDCWDSDDSPPPLPARTPESFILATGAFVLVTSVFPVAVELLVYLLDTSSGVFFYGWSGAIGVAWLKPFSSSCFLKLKRETNELLFPFYLVSYSVKLLGPQSVSSSLQRNTWTYIAGIGSLFHSTIS